MLRRFMRDLGKYWAYSVISADSMLKAEVRNCYLGWLWWIIVPVCFMMTYTFVFDYVFSAGEPYFPIFIFIGISLWEFFSKMVRQSVKAVKSNKAIVSKVYLPKYILILVMLWINGFKMMISFTIVAFMMVLFKVSWTWYALYWFPLFLVLALLAFGCAVHLMHYGIFVEDLSNIVALLLRFLFYVTGIFYDVAARIPQPYGDVLVSCNPMAFLMSAMRDALLYQKAPDIILLLIWLFLSLLLCLSGVRKIYKNENSYVKVI